MQSVEGDTAEYSQRISNTYVSLKAIIALGHNNAQHYYLLFINIIKIINNNKDYHVIKDGFQQQS